MDYAVAKHNVLDLCVCRVCKLNVFTTPKATKRNLRLCVVEVVQRLYTNLTLNPFKRVLILAWVLIFAHEEGSTAYFEVFIACAATEDSARKTITIDFPKKQYFVNRS
jgi:hypothetical protein